MLSDSFQACVFEKGCCRRQTPGAPGWGHGAHQRNPWRWMWQIGCAWSGLRSSGRSSRWIFSLPTSGEHAARWSRCPSARQQQIADGHREQDDRAHQRRTRGFRCRPNQRHRNDRDRAPYGRTAHKEPRRAPQIATVALAIVSLHNAVLISSLQSG